MRMRGFTLTEVILIIVILGVLAVSSFPKFLNISGEAEDSYREGIASAVSAGIALFRANDIVANGEPGSFPAALDDVPDKTFCSAKDMCFSKVLSSGVEDGRWFKENGNDYRYDDGTKLTIYIYDPANGIFKKSK